MTIRIDVTRQGFTVTEVRSSWVDNSSIHVNTRTAWARRRGAEAVVPWASLRGLEAIDPWPGFRVTWIAREPRGGTVLDGLFALFEKPDEAEMRAVTAHAEKEWTRSWRPEREDAEAFARVVEELFAQTARRSRAALDRGWLDVPVIEWERVAAMPAPVVAVDTGAYRTAQRSGGERIVAERDGHTVLGALLLWAASTPKRPWREQARRHLVTEDHLYVERYDRSVWRLPLDALRVRLGSRDGDAVYVFGRNTRLPLPHIDDCPVAATLEDALVRARRRRRR